MVRQLIHCKESTKNDSLQRINEESTICFLSHLDKDLAGGNPTVISIFQIKRLNLAFPNRSISDRVPFTQMRSFIQLNKDLPRLKSHHKGLLFI